MHHSSKPRSYSSQQSNMRFIWVRRFCSVKLHQRTVIFHACSKFLWLSKYMAYILLKNSTTAISPAPSTPTKTKHFIHYPFSFLGLFLPFLHFIFYKNRWRINAYVTWSTHTDTPQMCFTARRNTSKRIDSPAPCLNNAEIIYKLKHGISHMLTIL